MLQNIHQTSFNRIWITSFLLFAALYISLFYSISQPLFDVDEGAFSEASREMLASHNFISPRLDNEPRFDKPILIYWLQAASMRLGGINETAARLPAALASCLWAALIFIFLHRLGYTQTGLFAATIMASSLEIAIIGKAATADTLLNLWLCGSMFSLFLYFTQGQQRFLYMAFASMGLGFLTKGPVAVLIPAAATFIYTFFTANISFKQWFKAMFDPLSILIFLLITLPWYIAEYMQDGFAFIEGFFLKHNIGRFSQAMETHGGGWWYYLPIIIIGLLPFSGALISIMRQWRQFHQDSLRRFLWVWFLFVLALFSLSSTKLPHYIVYGFTPLFILMALELSPSDRSLHSLSSPNHLTPWIFTPALCVFVILAALPPLLTYTESTLTDPATLAVYASLNTSFSSTYLWVQGLFITIACIAIIFKPLRRVYTLFLCALLLSWDINHFVLPTVATVQQQPVKEAALLAKKNNWHVHHWRIKTPSFSFYRQQASLHTPPGRGDIVLTRQPFLSDFHDGYTLLYQKNGIALVRLQ